MKRYTLHDLCPGCGDPLARHESDGCAVGWRYDASGVATTEGCLCNLTLADAPH